MAFVEGQQILYRGLDGDDNWYKGVYIRRAFSLKSDVHALKSRFDFEIHRKTKHIRPFQPSTNEQAKTLLEETY